MMCENFKNISIKTTLAKTLINKTYKNERTFIYIKKNLLEISNTTQ